MKHGLKWESNYCILWSVLPRGYPLKSTIEPSQLFSKKSFKYGVFGDPEKTRMWTTLLYITHFLIR